MEKYRGLMEEFPREGAFTPKKDAVYPDYKKYTYYSRTAERNTNVNILLPPDYSTDKKYPVVYMLHGYFCDENWMKTDIPDMGVMLSNLYENKEAAEMIMVCPYIFCSKEKEHCTGLNPENSLCYDNFINDLTTDLMPFIESSFSVAGGRENTAITGFSMGGREALFIGFKRPDLFGYIGAVAPAPGLTPGDDIVTHPGQMQETEMCFEENKPYLLLITTSESDNVVGSSPMAYHKILETNKTEHLWHVLKNTAHDNTSVKPHLYNFCRMIFR